MRNSNERRRPLCPFATSFQLQIKGVLYARCHPSSENIRHSRVFDIPETRSTQTAIRILIVDASRVNLIMRFATKKDPCQVNFLNDQAILIRFLKFAKSAREEEDRVEAAVAFE